MVFPCDGFKNVECIDREWEMTRLNQLVSFSVNQEIKLTGSQRIIHIIGKSEVGKTFLLCNYDKDISLRNIRSAYLSFEKFSNQSGDEFFKNVLNSLATSLGFQTDNFLGKEKNEISFFFIHELEIMQRNNIVVFLMDEVSMLLDDQVYSLEDYLLTPALNLPNIIMILAGRHLVTGWKNFDLRADEANVVELSNFDFEYSQKQIQSINSHANTLVTEIHEISGGSPGNNRKIVEQLGDQPHFNGVDAIRVCNQEFYEALASVSEGQPDSVAIELLFSLEALCVLQDFDKEYEMPLMLAAHPTLYGDWTVQRCSSLLNILSEVQVGPGKLVAWSKEKNALAIEEQTRFNLEKELNIRDMDLWKNLHCTAMKMYAGWAVQYGADSIFADKAEYHKVQLIKAGIDPETCG